MTIKYFLLTSALLCSANAYFGSMKNVTVTGKLYCGYMPAKNVTVELWEDDTVLGIGSDDMLNATNTNYDGKFMVYGEERELLSIEPYILIKHQCDINRCNVIDRRDIPKHYLGGTYNILSVELIHERRGRTRVCH